MSLQHLELQAYRYVIIFPTLELKKKKYVHTENVNLLTYISFNFLYILYMLVN